MIAAAACSEHQDDAGANVVCPAAWAGARCPESTLQFSGLGRAAAVPKHRTTVRNAQSQATAANQGVVQSACGGQGCRQCWGPRVFYVAGGDTCRRFQDLCAHNGCDVTLLGC